MLIAPLFQHLLGGHGERASRLGRQLVRTLIDGVGIGPSDSVAGPNG
jgi:hypothetical protein